MKKPENSEERHGEPRRDDFAALFAMLDQPVSAEETCAAYEKLLVRAASPSFRRETLGKGY